MSDKKRRVEVYENATDNDEPRVLIGEGIFHQYGIGYRVFDYTSQQITVAVVEMLDGFVRLVPVENIRFIPGGTI